MGQESQEKEVFMKRKVVMSLVLLAVIGAGVVFAQQPTLDKLTFTLNNQGTAYSVGPANNSISGAVVIPSTYNGLPVTGIVSYIHSRKLPALPVSFSRIALLRYHRAVSEIAQD
jgi:hypothetical protein